MSTLLPAKTVRVSVTAGVLALACIFVPSCSTSTSPPAARGSTSSPGATTSPRSTVASATLVFDGRASRMTSLRCDPSACSQAPDQWSVLQFCGDDITLQSDPRFGRVYRYTTNARSNLAGCPSGPIWSPDVAYASLSHVPSYQVLGTVAYYRESIFLPKGFAFISPGWESLMQYGFGSYDGAVSLGLRQDFGHATHFELSLDGGQVVNCKGPSWWYHGNVVDLGAAASLEGHWVDFVVGIRWETNDSGWVDVYMRVPDLGQRLFVRKVHVTGKPTYQWGTCGRYDISERGTTPNGATVHYVDQQNDYEGYLDNRPLSRFPSHTFLRTGYVITRTLAAAEAVSP